MIAFYKEALKSLVKRLDCNRISFTNDKSSVTLERGRSFEIVKHLNPRRN